MQLKTDLKKKISVQVPNNFPISSVSCHTNPGPLNGILELFPRSSSLLKQFYFPNFIHTKGFSLLPNCHSIFPNYSLNSYL